MVIFFWLSWNFRKTFWSKSGTMEEVTSLFSSIGLVGWVDVLVIFYCTCLIKLALRIGSSMPSIIPIIWE